MYIPITHSLSPLDLVRSLGSRAVPPRSEDRIYFSLGRHALRLLAQILAGQGIKEILVPAYICREALAELDAVPVHIRFYEVRPDLAPDLEALPQFPSGTAAFLLVHYFGFPNAPSEVSRFCRDQGLIFIEDCAQSLYSAHGGWPLGSLGDAAFFSPRKFLSIPHGAYAVIHRPELRGAVRKLEGSNAASAITLSRDLGRWLLLRIGMRWQGGNHLELTPEEQPLEGRRCPPGMSALAHRLLAWHERRQETVIARRRDHYLRLLEGTEGLPVTPLFPHLPPQVCPLAFPFRVFHRDEVLLRLRRRGIGAQFWPTLPSGIIDNPQFPQANRFRRELLLLPVHQDLSPRHLAYLLDGLTEAVHHAA